MLLSVGQDDSYTHIIWKDVGGQWSRVQQLATAKSDKSTGNIYAYYIMIVCEIKIIVMVP